MVDDPTGLGVNRAGFVIHGCMHEARPEVNCVIHTHTRAGVAVSAQKAGLLPMSQHALRVYGMLSYHDYEGIALDMDERTRMAARPGPDFAGHDPAQPRAAQPGPFGVPRRSS